MDSFQIGESLNKILKKEKINPINALKEFVIMKILGEKEKYLIEKKKFEEKYKSDFQSIEKKNHSENNKENFEIEDDLMDWEFAIESLKNLEEELIELNKIE